jgi:hypothetical protein
MTSFKLIQNASYATISDVWKNERYTLLSIQVENTFATADIRIECRISPTAEWKEIGLSDDSTMEFVPTPITSPGIYKASIEGIYEIRVRVVSVTGGSVNINGIFYNSTDGEKIPSSPTISQIQSTLFDTNSNLIVKGVAETFYFDPENGNIVGYEHEGTEATVNISANYQLLEGGFLNKLIGVFPDSTRVEGTYTEQAFSLEEKALAFSQSVLYGAATPVCDVLEPVNGKLYVTKPPVARTGASKPSCFVHIRGEQWSGTAYEIDPVSREVLGYAPESGEEYEVQYYISSASSKEIGIPTRFSPKVYTVQIRYGVYAMRGALKGRSSLVGWLCFVVPRAVFTVNETMNGSNTTNVVTSHDWKAISDDEVSVGLGSDCPSKKAPVGYYIYIPCDATEGIADIIVVGNGLSIRANQTALPPVKLVMKDNSLVQPDFSSLGYMSEDESIAEVSPTGYIKGVSEGETYVDIYVSKYSGEPLKARCKVTVTSLATRITLNRSHIAGL